MSNRRISRQRSIYRVHYALPPRIEEMARPVAPPPFHKRDVTAYGRQVAGHMSMKDEKYLGVLQCNNGTILKPIIKESQKREIDFYTTVNESTDEELLELQKFIPRYYGCRLFEYHGYEQRYLVLEDLAERMLEPCIMDVKMGKRTWDPLATEQKIQNERTKYAACKQEYGFCIPGYQVHRLANGKLYRYDKDYGKKLHGQMVKTAIRNFLNGVGSPLCRALILQFLSSLWRVQQWAARQTRVKLYSASLLLAYDAARVRECCGDQKESWNSECRQRLPRRSSLPALAAPPSPPGRTLSGQLANAGPVYKKLNSVPLTPIKLVQSSFSSPAPTSPWNETLERLHHNHSFDHNYEDKLSKIKMNYRAMLDQLSTDTPTPNPWGTVKIIDFAHAFFNEEDDSTIDQNFKEGIDNFVAIFEELLRETDDQVF